MTYAGKRELLNIRRRQSLLSQIAVASKLGIGQSQYSYIENGYANPNDEQAATLIEMFDLPKDYFQQDGENDDGKEPDS